MKGTYRVMSQKVPAMREDAKSETVATEGLQICALKNSGNCRSLPMDYSGFGSNSIFV